jgi:hypothetical protein
MGLEGPTGATGPPGPTGPVGPKSDERYFARRVRKAALVIPPNSFPIIAWDTPTGGDDSLFNAAGEYVAPVGGLYRVAAQWSISHRDTDPSTSLLVGIMVNTGFRAISQRIEPPGLAAQILQFSTFAVGSTLSIFAGQRIGVAVGYSNRATEMAVNVGDGSMHTFFEVERVGEIGDLEVDQGPEDLVG